MPPAEARYVKNFVPRPIEMFSRFGRQVRRYDADTGRTVPAPRELTNAFSDWSRHVEGLGRYGFSCDVEGTLPVSGPTVVLPQ